MLTRSHSRSGHAAVGSGLETNGAAKGDAAFAGAPRTRGNFGDIILGETLVIAPKGHVEEPTSVEFTIYQLPGALEEYSTDRPFITAAVKFGPSGTTFSIPIYMMVQL